MACDSIDTNIIVRTIIADNRAQREAAWRLLSEGKHRVLDAAVTETIYVLESVYQQDRLSIANELTSFFHQFCNTLDYNITIVKMILPFWATHPSLSFVDCYLAFSSELLQTEPLITLDKKLAAQHPSAKLLQSVTI